MCPSHLPTIAQLVLGNFRTLFENVAQISIITVAKTPKTIILIKRPFLTAYSQEIHIALLRGWLMFG
jgi:hypothetical protein